LSGGTGVEDAAVAKMIYDRAVANNIGEEVAFGAPYEWVM
jgi:ornithine cyclodeaminase/alanine dehydrogenase-like protein (mu-crystallin family)